MFQVLASKVNLNSKSNHSEHWVAFRAGLTPKMLQEIEATDVLEISNRLAKKEIPTDFQHNKVVAWCCDKTVRIIEQFNKNFKTKLSLPKGIYVEDFRHLHDNPNAFGTCNLLPFELRRNSKERIPEKTIFFNSSINWDDVDRISDVNFAGKMFSSDFFLYPFMHEFTHAIHVDRLIQKFEGDELVSKVELAREHKPIQILTQQRKDEIASICNYALKNPLDTIACDLPTKIISGIDKETLVPRKNPFITTPYELIPFWKKQPKTSGNSLDQILRSFWNGDFN